LEIQSKIPAEKLLMGMYSRIQGTLAKPSGKTRTVAQAMRSNRHAKATDRYQELKAEIHRWHKDGFKVAEYLREVRDDKLYVKEYSSFEEFCLEEFGWKRSQAYALAAWAENKAISSVRNCGLGQDGITGPRARFCTKREPRCRARASRSRGTDYCKGDSRGRGGKGY
jgi:hypothetical protein